MQRSHKRCMVIQDFRALKIALGPLKKNLKIIVFNTSKPLLQHPLCGILGRAGAKNDQNGPSSFSSFALFPPFF